MALANENQGRPNACTDSDSLDMLDDQHVCAYRMAPDGTIIAASPALVRLLGYTSSAELCARSSDGDAYDAAYAQAMFARHGGRITQIESAWARADGSIVHVRESATASYDEQGRPIHYDGVIELVLIPTREFGPLTPGKLMYLKYWVAEPGPGPMRESS